MDGLFAVPNGLRATVDDDLPDLERAIKALDQT